MSLQPTEAAFEGFRIVRRTPMVLVWWTLLYAAISLLSYWIMTSNIDALIAFSERAEEFQAIAEGGGQPSSAELGAFMQAWAAAMAPFSWLIPLSLIISSVLAAAVARAVLRPSEKAFGFLRLGGDELRVLVVSLVLTILICLAGAGLVIAVAILAGFATNLSGGAQAGIGILGVLAALGVMIWLLIRWSLAIPITVAEGRMAFFDSFRLTKGRFWPLLGMAVIAVIMAIIIGLLSLIVAAPISLAAGGDVLGSMNTQDPAEALRSIRLDNPWMIASVILDAVINILCLGIVYAPFSAAYRDIVGGSARTAA